MEQPSICSKPLTDVFVCCCWRHDCLRNGPKLFLKLPSSSACGCPEKEVTLKKKKKLNCLSENIQENKPVQHKSFTQVIRFFLQRMVDKAQL